MTCQMVIYGDMQILAHFELEEHAQLYGSDLFTDVCTENFEMVKWSTWSWRGIFNSELF